MGLSWLHGEDWQDATREERYFCACLFYVIRKQPAHFISFLNEKLDKEGKAPLDAGANWQAAYEICFFRDMKKKGIEIGEELSLKRTFDLALFSDDEIVLIEAKAQQGFTTKQLKHLCSDLEHVKQITGVKRTCAFGLISSKYTPAKGTRSFFHNLIVTWCALASLYEANPHAKTFLRADQLYRK